MQQYGLTLNGSQIIDKLAYTYQKEGELSNKLLSVSEDNLVGSKDNKLGDFTDRNRSGMIMITTRMVTWYLIRIKVS